MHSFLLDIATDTFTDIEVTGATNVYAWGINRNGAVALGSDAGSYIWCAKARQWHKTARSSPLPRASGNPSRN